MAGPSNAGLTDPGQGAAISLLQVTAVLAVQLPTLDTNVALRTMTTLAAEIGEAFGDAHKRLVDDEAALKAAERRALAR